MIICELLHTNRRTDPTAHSISSRAGGHKLRGTTFIRNQGMTLFLLLRFARNPGHRTCRSDIASASHPVSKIFSRKTTARVKRTYFFLEPINSVGVIAV
jgi:hypothetical protein